MSSITKEQRIQSWNVQIWVGRKRIAGVYQRDNLLSVADIAHELELCLIFDKPGAPWQPALLDVETKRLIILDYQNNLPFPTPDGLRDYTYVFHSPQCSRDLHSLVEPCIRCATLPNRRADPRYQEIGKQSQDDRLSMVPLRKVATLKRRSTSASPVSRSPSPIKMSCLDEPIPRVVISPDEARPFINDFRANVLANWCTCVISSKGESWFRSGIVGPGIEAAHIVPQVQWNTYPVDDDRGVADLNDVNQLKQAWISTWETSNGFPLLSHLHKCFNARLVSIHPETHVIRAFVNYDVITDFHGKKAKMSRNIDQRALQHHWDMCCLENTPQWSLPYPSKELPYPSNGLGNIPKLPGPSSYGNMAQEDPSKEQSTQAYSDTQAADTQTSNTQASNTQASRKISYQASGITAIPPSPPPSEPASEECTLWRFGNKIIKDPVRARELIKQGWIVQCINESESRVIDEDPGSPNRPRDRRMLWRFGHTIIKDPLAAEQLMEEGWLLEVVNNEKRGRGRSLEKRRCVATDQDADDDGRHGTKRQRIEHS